MRKTRSRRARGVVLLHLKQRYAQQQLAFVLILVRSALCLVSELLALKFLGAETRQSGFSDSLTTHSAASIASQVNGTDGAAAAAAAAAAVAAAQVASAPQMADAYGPKTATVQIPATLVGKVIGKGGETIKNLQNQSRTRIQIDHTAPGDTKTITITSESNPDYLEAAKHLIQQVISDDSPQGEVQRSVECPPGIVGRIIGRGGETIRALQQASQAYIVVDQNFPEGHPRKVNISGRADAVERASRMVTELIQGEPGSATAIIQKVINFAIAHLHHIADSTDLLSVSCLCAGTDISSTGM